MDHLSALPPEIRNVIISHVVDNDVNVDSPPGIRLHLGGPLSAANGSWMLRIKEDASEPDYYIPDVPSSVALARTCRKLRSEVLAMLYPRLTHMEISVDLSHGTYQSQQSWLAEKGAEIAKLPQHIRPEATRTLDLDISPPHMTHVFGPLMECLYWGEHLESFTFMVKVRSDWNGTKLRDYDMSGLGFALQVCSDLWCRIRTRHQVKILRWKPLYLGHLPDNDQLEGPIDRIRSVERWRRQRYGLPKYDDDDERSKGPWR